MQKYTYYISAVLDDGKSSIDYQTSTKESAFILLNEIKNQLKNMNDFDKKHTSKIELIIDRNHTNIFYKNVNLKKFFK